MSQPGAGPVVVLIGPPGSGKSTIGERVAARLGVVFRDTDADVEAAAGLSVADIFVRSGEDAFRAMEREAVARALTEADGVLALGGGAPMDPDTATLLAGRPVVFLDVSLAAAAPRVGFNQSRPLLLGNPRSQWKALMEARRPQYAALARWIVDTSDATPDEVAKRIVDLVRQGPEPRVLASADEEAPK